MTSDQWVMSLSGAAIMLLLGGNMYFIKRLVDKIDAAASTAAAANSAVAAMSGFLREIKADIKDLRRIEIDVAVLKSSFTSRKKNGVDDDESATDS